MKKLYCVFCGKYRKFKNPKIKYIFEKRFFLLLTASAIFKEEYLKKKNKLRY